MVYRHCIRLGVQHLSEISPRKSLTAGRCKEPLKEVNHFECFLWMCMCAHVFVCVCVCVCF